MREKARQTETDTQKWTHRDIHTERQRETQTQTDRETHRETETA